MSVSLDVQYEAGHSYRETWKLAGPPFCPNCGQGPTWIEDGAGDYYEGPHFLCVLCEHTWTMPRLDRATSPQDTQRLNAIRDSRGESA